MDQAGVARGVAAADVAFGDAHAVNRQMPPAVGARAELRPLARLDAPHLLFAAAVILPVVGDAERWRAGLVPSAASLGNIGLLTH